MYKRQALYAAVDGHETIPAYEEAAERTGDHFWMLGLNELLRPRDASESQVVYAYESYNEYTEIKPIDDHNIESSATITFPPMELTYHYATFHRIWDYITLSMIGAHFDASIPYMGNESFESRLAVTLRDLHVVMPAATSAATANAPHAIVQVGTLTSVKLQRSEEGFAKGDGGMLITLHDVAILVSDATASGFASPLAVANSPSTEEDADEVEEVEDRDDESLSLIHI